MISAPRGRRNIVLIALVFGLLGCGHMPVTSMVKLARVDFQTTDLDKLRVAVNSYFLRLRQSEPPVCII